MLDLSKLTHPTVILGGSVLFVVFALALWRAGIRRRAADQDVFKLLGTSARAAQQRVATSPVDLSRPIRGDADWLAIRAHARDAAYRRAVDTVRNRYQIVNDPMLLSNTIRTTMERWRLSFRDAMIRVAEDDGLRRMAMPWRLAKAHPGCPGRFTHYSASLHQSLGERAHRGLQLPIMERGRTEAPTMLDRRDHDVPGADSSP